jgi:glyoxylase-like metal-dependent hydrolase (beta-lactamase superfamily II)
VDHHRRRQNLANPLTRAALFLCLIVLATGASAQQAREPLRPEWCRQLPRPQYKKLVRVVKDEKWFEVYRIRDGVFAIYEPHQFEEVISYLIVGQRRALLFDTGMGIGKISALVARLTPLPVTALNSHTHFDHTGGNAEFADILGVDTPFTRNNEKGQSNNYSRDALAPERICGALPAGVQVDSYTVRPYQITHWVKDGERIDLGGRELEILFTPGHTPDSLSLLDRANGLLFTGDTFYPGPIYLITPETDFAAYARSAGRLAELAPRLKLLLPGHNLPTASPGSLLQLHEAVSKVTSGNQKPVPAGDYREYRFDGFSLLLAAN